MAVLTGDLSESLYNKSGTKKKEKKNNGLLCAESGEAAVFGLVIGSCRVRQSLMMGENLMLENLLVGLFGM